MGGFVRDAVFAGANAEQCLLRDALKPVVLHDLVHGVVIDQNGQGVEHVLRLHTAGGAAGLGGQLRRVQQRHHHQIAAGRQRSNAVLGQGGGVCQQTEGRLRVGLCQRHDLCRISRKGIQQPDIAAVLCRLGDHLRQAFVPAACRCDPRSRLAVRIGLLFQLACTVDQAAEAHIDTDRADAILIHGIQQAVDQAVIAAVGALQGLLCVGKKVFLLRLFCQRGTHVHIIAQLPEAPAADVPYRAVRQRHRKAACTVIVHRQSVHSLSFHFKGRHSYIP